MLTYAVVLLAAGASSRMGRPKLLLPWAGSTVLADLIGRWRELGATQIAVVVASPGGSLAEELDRLEVAVADRIVNPDPGRGMFSSVQCAARWPGWHRAATHWVLTLGDQPHVCTGTLRALLEFAAAHEDCVSQPARYGRPRHPVVLPAPVFRRLAGADAEDLKQFLGADAGPRALQESPDDGLDFDMDEPADYERALRHAASWSRGSA